MIANYAHRLSLLSSLLRVIIKRHWAKILSQAALVINYSLAVWWRRPQTSYFNIRAMSRTSTRTRVTWMKGHFLLSWGIRPMGPSGYILRIIIQLVGKNRASTSQIINCSIVLRCEKLSMKALSSEHSRSYHFKTRIVDKLPINKSKKKERNATYSSSNYSTMRSVDLTFNLRSKDHQKHLTWPIRVTKGLYSQILPKV